MIHFIKHEFFLQNKTCNLTKYFFIFFVFCNGSITIVSSHDKIANFDCRIYQAPSLHDACLQLLWRENDATKNSVAMLAQSLFSHKDLQGLHGGQMQDKMMLEKGVNWNDLEPKYKRGTYVKRIKTSKPFTPEELNQLSPNHNAHRNPDLIIERNVVSVVDMPIFSKIENRVDVVFFDAEPKMFEVLV
jgi:tRNA(His) 5'-end guanylyltransferase